MRGNHLVREARRRAGLTQAEVAERAGTTQSAVARTERGVTMPSLEQLTRLVRAAGFDIDVRLVPYDDHEWTMAERNRGLDVDHRVRNMKRAERFARSARQAAVATDFAPEKVLAVLERHGVDYVLIGGLAATIHGSPYVTTDVDVTPDPDPANVGRLSAALTDLGARVRNRDDEWRVTTKYGALDVTFVPPGTGGYDDLRRDAIDLEVLGVHVPVASLADVVRSKAAAARAKDELVLPTLRRLLDESP